MADPDSRLRVSVVDALGRPIRARALAAWLARVAPRRARGQVTVALVGDARIRALNRRYRKKDAVTDVLSFSNCEWGPTPTRARSGARPTGRASLRPLARAAGAPPCEWGCSGVLGDIVIARGLAARQARARGHSLQMELRILALHGLLHLIGYDHERDRGQMRRLEARLRRRGGLPAGLIDRTR